MGFFCGRNYQSAVKQSAVVGQAAQSLIQGKGRPQEICRPVSVVKNPRGPFARKKTTKYAWALRDGTAWFSLDFLLQKPGKFPSDGIFLLLFSKRRRREELPQRQNPSL